MGESHVVTPELSREVSLRPGDETAAIGLYRDHPGRDRILPIVRSGVISAMPEEPLETRLGPM